MTVPLVANAIIQAGAKVKFFDKVEWVGKTYELEPWGIIDSAHRVVKGQFKNECWGHNLLCYSFYPTKPITSAEGGMILTNDGYAAKWLKKARWYGREDDSSKVKNSWEYDIEFPGWKMNMTDVQAAIAIEQLKKHDEIEVKMDEVREDYNRQLELSNDSNYLYRINVPDRDEFIPWMHKRGVECGVHFKPLHWMKCFKNGQKLPKTDAEARTTASLPFHSALKSVDVYYICNLVKAWKKRQTS